MTAPKDKPDFEALRAQRNAAVEEVIKAACARHGFDPSKAYTSFNPDACYCACPDGPCEHDWQGWRDIEDDAGNMCGGERVCARCGMGAMSHDIRVAP